VGARFSTPVQSGPGAHPASYFMGTGSFPGVERPGRGVDHPPLSGAEVLFPLSAFMACSRVNFTFFPPTHPRSHGNPDYDYSGPEIVGFPGNSDYLGPGYQETTVEKFFFFS